MNPLGMSEIIRMGCFCIRQSVMVNSRRFYIKTHHADGGFSTIDLVEEASTRRQFALKRIVCHSKDDETVALREVEVMQLFRHRNLVPLEEWQLVPLDRYTRTLDTLSEVLIVMPFYRHNLQEKLDQLQRLGKTLKESEIWMTFLAVCSAVREMHSYDPPYAHRDIKPGNIMIDCEDVPVLMDLGSALLARVDIRNIGDARSLQDEAAERCSMLYRAPELFNVDLSSNIDERTDIWSLGCILYALAFLESPFEKAYQRGDSIALAAGSRNVHFPQHHSYTKAIEDLVLTMMVVNPMERPFIDQVIEVAESKRTPPDDVV